MLKRFAVGAAMLLLAAVLGIGSAWWSIRQGGTDTIRNGAWTTNPAVGSPRPILIRGHAWP